MLSHSEFQKLRLSQFIDASEITELVDWEFLGRQWVGEAIGFTEWLRPQSSPDLLGSIALELEELPARVAEACLHRIGLPVRRHMTLSQLVDLFGEPLRSLSFVEDRVTHEFRVDTPDQYVLSCTLVAGVGLNHVVIALPQYASDVDVES
jgi:hypothetical protein